jgi:outer membrane protein TolC
MRPTLLIILGLAGASGWAEDLTVARAVAVALEGNPAVSAARSVADAAAAREERAKGFRLPSLDLSETYIGTNTPAEAFALKLNQKRFDFGAFVEGNPNEPEWLDTWLTRLELVQPVYTGGKLSARIGQSQAMASAAELEWVHARERVGFDTITAFTNLAKAREYHALLNKARSTTAAHVELAEQYAGQGLIVEAEVLKARVYLAEMDERLAQADMGARLAEAALNFHMGEDQGTGRTLGPLPPMPAVDGTLEGWIDAATEQRRDLAAARHNLEAGRLEEKVARSPLLPEVAVVGRYDLYDDTILGANGASGSVMAVAKINLFRGGADRAGRAAARHDTASHEHNIHRFEEGVRLEVREAWHELQTSRARHASAREALQSATEALRVREQRFRQGLDRMIDLLDAETALRESESRELVARYDLALATYRLYFASGRSLIDLVLPMEKST